MSLLSFSERLLMRLKSGDSRSIHLNALPGNFARLDIYDLINIEQSLHLQFLENLLTKKEFKFTITIPPIFTENKNAEERKKIQHIIKRLNYLDYEYKEEFIEHGFHSFAFGYPLFIKKDKNNSDKIIKAPIFIWYLNIEKDTKKNNTWIISRNEEHPLVFNELLQSYLESVETIRLSELDTLIEDNFIDEQQLNNFCKILLEKFNIPFDATTNIATILPCTNKESIYEYTKDAAWIRWSGVLGLYKMQKQPIIKDLQQIIDENIEPTLNENGFYESEVLTPITLDPSQENVLHQLNFNNNIIIQGPPGTGKSQSLTAIITQALLNNKKILVVCEKRTAMEVLYNNLKKENLHHLCVIIDDVYSDRKNIVETVRSIIEQQNTNTTIRFRNSEYEALKAKFLTLQEEINHQINFNNTLVFGDDNWTELLLNSYVLNTNNAVLEKANALNKIIRNSDYSFNYDEYILLEEKIKIANALYLSVNKNSFNYNHISNEQILLHDSYENIYTDIKTQYEQANTLQNKITKNIIAYSNNYNVLDNWRATFVAILSYFSSKYKTIKTEKQTTIEEYQKIKINCTNQPYFNYEFSDVSFLKKIEFLFPSLKSIQATTQQILAQEEHFKTFFSYKKFLLQQDIKTQNIINALAKTDDVNWQIIFKTYYLNQTIIKISLGNGIKDNTTLLFEELHKTDELLKQQLSGKISAQWSEKISEKIKQYDISELKYLFNQRKNKQFESKNSLRKIIHHDFDFFSTMFPVIMVNPVVCCSIMPLQENLFDCIILDESSQLRIEDTYPALIRGKTKIISGDKHQMPPSNFFGNDVVFWTEEDDNDEINTHDFLASSKSLLEYADDAGYKNMYLDYHYRSEHPDLISFSNHAFYQSRLIPLPAIQPYQAIHYYQLDGIYNNGTNAKEAEKIVDFIFNINPTHGVYPSIGIATFNIFQRNLILDKLHEEAYSNKSKNEHLQQLLQKGLFVKNLENIQGDERDIMLISTTFGKDSDGKFRQFFGPLTQEKGYQLLNVIITRAKHALHIFTSVPETYIQQFETELKQKGNTGKGIFYAYLAYSKANMEQNISQQNYIRTVLQQHHKLQNIDINKTTISIIQQQLFNSLKKYFDSQIILNYPLGGFILDVVILENNVPKLYIDIALTQQQTETAYRTKLHLQKTTLKYGIKSYNLWIYNWWLDADKEILSIINFLSA